MITDYTSLQTAVGKWLKRETEQDFTDEIPTFIQLAENEMYTGQVDVALRCREQQYRGRALLNEEYEWLPGAQDGERGFLETQWCKLVDTDAEGKVTETPMDYLDEPDFLRAPGNQSQPLLYTIFGEQIRFKPDPTQNPPTAPAKWEFEISYYGRFAPLSATVPVNDILTRYPQIYLYGSLLQAEGYVANDQRIALWKSNYLAAIESANRTAESGRRGTSAIGPPQ